MFVNAQIQVGITVFAVKHIIETLYHVKSKNRVLIQERGTIYLALIKLFVRGITQL